MVYKLMSVLTMIAEEIVSGLTDSKVMLRYTWIDMGLRNPYGVGHLLQDVRYNKVKKVEQKDSNKV